MPGSGRVERNGTWRTAAMRSSGTAAPASTTASLGQQSAVSTGSARPTVSSVAADPDHGDQRRRQQRAEAEGGNEHALEDAEHARDHLGWAGALHEGHRRHVDEGVSDADDRERDDRDPRVGKQAEQGERQAPEHEPGAEIAGQALPSDEREHHRRSDQGADAAHRLEQAEPGVAHVQQAERRRDEQHAEGAGDEALRAVEADQQPQARLGADGADARPHAAVLLPSRRRSATGALEWTPVRRNALQANVPAVTQKTVPGPPATSRAAPSAGPANSPTLSKVLDERFAAVSSSGERASVGSSAASAGRKTVANVVIRVASA